MIMKKNLLFAVLLSATATVGLHAQDIKAKDVPATVKAAFVKKYPESAKFKVSWEKEKGNFEANWGGKSGEANSAVFTPAAGFVELVVAIPVSALPAAVAPYVKSHYKKAIAEAGKVTDASGKQFYEAEVKGEKDLIFDLDGKFVKAD
jgi:hypothetical protein